jgi:hypothetical protein
VASRPQVARLIDNPLAKISELIQINITIEA